MIRLIGVEIRRLLSRRLLRVLGVVSILGFLLAAILTYINTDAASPEAAAMARRQWRTEVGRCIAVQRSQGQNLPPEYNGDAEAFCEEQIPLQAFDSSFHLTDLTEIFVGLGMVVVILGLLVGASFVGAEWHHRTLTTLLTWEPRRYRVILSKLIACAFVVFVAALLFLSLLGASMLPTVLAKGTTAGADGTWLRELLETAGRIGVLATLAATAGLAIATIGRNTAAALGAGFVYLAVVESVIRGFKPQWAPWLLGDNGALVMAGPQDVNHISHTLLEATLVVVAYTAVVLLVAVVLFRTRDVG